MCNHYIMGNDSNTAVSNNQLEGELVDFVLGCPSDCKKRHAHEDGCVDDPLKFVMAAFPWGEPGRLKDYEGPDTWQKELLIELGEEIRKRKFDGVHAVDPIRMTRASGHGIGKGVMSAMLTCFLMSTRPFAIGTITANSYPQLETKTWATLRKWTKDCITSEWFKVTGDKMVRLGYEEQWFVSAMSCAEENAQAFAGQHNANSTSFYIIDEGSNVPDAIYNVADGGLTDGEPMIFVFGNPTRRTGKFYRINFGSERGRWLHKAIDSRTCLYGNKNLHEEWKQDWGEDSDRFRVQVKGLPPAASDLQFISSSLVAEAQRREPIVLRSDPLICGLDVARGGADSCVFRFRRGLDAKSIPPIRITGLEAMDSTVLVNKALDLLRNGVLLPNTADKTPFGSTPADRNSGIRMPISMLFIDGTGVGGPVCDQIKNLGYRDRVTEIQFAWEAPNTQGYEECANMRSWMWELMKKWMAKGSIDSSPDLETDLTGPMYHYSAKNQLVLESKEAIKKRNATAFTGGSPDDGDALALSFARPVAPLRKNWSVEDEELANDSEDYGGQIGTPSVWG